LLELKVKKIIIFYNTFAILYDMALGSLNGIDLNQAKWATILPLQQDDSL